MAKAAAEGINYQPGWILAITTTVKIFIDIFIGIWAFILGYIWTNHINTRPTPTRRRPSEIWQRFPKFILGFVATFAISLGSGARIARRRIAASSPAAIGEANVLPRDLLHR